MGSIYSWDERRDLIVLQTQEEAITFAAEQWIRVAKRAIQHKGRFYAALSGGSTPKKIFVKIAADYKNALDWSAVHLFWSDERCVALDHPDSNYHMAMQSGLKNLGLSAHQIHPMYVKGDPESSATEYEALLHRILGSEPFDLMMLGVGVDGHTASLFPHSEALKEEKKRVVANFIAERGVWRITLTYPAIAKSDRIVIYALGKEKEAIVPLVLNSAIRSVFPASAIGTSHSKALWVLDSQAAHLLPVTGPA